MSDAPKVEVIETPAVGPVAVESANVDVARPESQNTSVHVDDAASVPESMEQYAARREAELRGEKPEPAKPAADEADEAEEVEVSTEAEAKPAKKGINKRFSELTEARDAAKAEAEAAKAQAAEAAAKATDAAKQAEAARAELEALKAQADELLAKVPVVPPADEDPAPSRVEFDDPDAYAAAIAAHAAREQIREANARAQALIDERRQEAEAARAKSQQEQIQAQITELHAGFQKRVAEVAPEYPDFADKVTNNDQLVIRNDIFFTIEQSQDAPHLLYHLADNPDVAKQLNNMQPLQAAIKLGELAAELRIARKPQVSKAAEPVTPIKSRSSPERKTPDEMSMEEYAAMREQEQRERNAQARKRRMN